MQPISLHSRTFAHAQFALSSMQSPSDSLSHEFQDSPRGESSPLSPPVSPCAATRAGTARRRGIADGGACGQRRAPRPPRQWPAHWPDHFDSPLPLPFAGAAGLAGLRLRRFVGVWGRRTSSLSLPPPFAGLPDWAPWPLPAAAPTPLDLSVTLFLDSASTCRARTMRVKRRSTQGSAGLPVEDRQHSPHRFAGQRTLLQPDYAQQSPFGISQNAAPA